MTQSHRTEAEIRGQIESWAAALRSKDVDGLIAHYTSDAAAADLAPPLWNVGARRLRENFEGWLATWAGPLGFEVRDLHVIAGADVAFARSSNRIYGTKNDGSSSDLWVRATICFRKVGTAWKVVHEHISVPFYMDGSFRAAIDLKP
jgi:PhnB protein